jgi:hypothetical protein
MNETPDDPEFLTVDAFLNKLQQLTDAYQKKGGEEGIR